jgi:hypothetical protein
MKSENAVDAMAEKSEPKLETEEKTINQETKQGIVNF